MMTPIKRSGILQKTAVIQYLRIPILLQTTHHCRLIDDKSPGSAFHTVTAVKSDKTRQKDRQMTTCRQSCRRNIFIKQNAV